MVEDATFYIVKPSVVKNRKLDERGNWTRGVNVLEKVFDHATKTNKQNIINVNRRVPLSNERYDRWKDIITMTSNSEVKNIINEYNEYCSNINNIATEMNMIYSMSKMLPNVEKVSFSDVKLDDNKFASKFDKEMKKYPMLRLLSIPWNDADRKLVADYIDTIESGLKAQTVLNSL
jgi:hypothetical protein